MVATGLRPKFGPQLDSRLHVIIEGIALCVHERDFVIFPTDHSEPELSARCFATRCTLAASGKTYWKTAFEPGRQPPLAKSSFKEATGVVLEVQPCDHVHSSTSSEAVPRRVAEPKPTSSSFSLSDQSPQNARAADVTLQWLPDFADAMASDL